jgi:hypothetical protein
MSSWMALMTQKLVFRPQLISLVNDHKINLTNACYGILLRQSRCIFTKSMLHEKKALCQGKREGNESNSSIMSQHFRFRERSPKTADIFKLENDPGTASISMNLDILKRNNQHIQSASSASANLAVTKELKAHFLHRENLAKEAEQLLSLKSKEYKNLLPKLETLKENVSPTLKRAVDSAIHKHHQDKQTMQIDVNDSRTNIINQDDQYVQHPNAWEKRALEVANRIKHKSKTIFRGNKRNETMAAVAAATFLAFEKRVRAIRAIDNLRKHKYDHGALREFATNAYVESFNAIKDVFKLNSNVSNVSMPSMDKHNRMRFKQALAMNKINLKMLSKEKPGGFCRGQATQHACLQMTHLYEINGVDGAPCSWCVLPRNPFILYPTHYILCPDLLYKLL